MWSDSHTPSAEELGRQAIAYLHQRRWPRLRFWRDPRMDLYDSISGFMRVVHEIDISSFTEEQFAGATELLNQVIDSTESYLARHIDPNDTSQCYFLGDAARRLKDARHWIVQGYSPDPAKRPPAADLERQMYRDAEEAFKSFA